MRFECKKCHKKFKVSNKNELKSIDCNKDNCQLKYKMNCDLIEFKDFKLEEPTIISEMHSPEPVKITNTISDEDWLKMCNGEYGGCG